MSLRATIDLESQKLLWSKSILSLTLVSDQIKFDIGEESLSISAINQSKTAQAEIQFKSSFFEKYHVSFDSAIKEGYDKSLRRYSFVVNSSHLSVIFKTFDIGSLIDIRVNFNYQFKLLLEINRKLILKKYQISYKPVINETDEVWLDFMKDVGDSNVNYVLIDKSTLKQFMEMLPSNVENCKLELKNEKIFFNGFNNQVVKDSKVLKQSISVTMSIAIEDLEYSKLIYESFDVITFGLKFFKIFIFLVSQVKFNDNSDDGFFQMHFKKSGDPILFEAKLDSVVTVSFSQLTNNLDSDNRSTLKHYKVEDVQRPTDDVTHSLDRSREFGSLSSRSQAPTSLARNAGSSGQKSPKEIDQLNFNSDHDSDMEFGPTQVDEVKSIFD